MSGRLWRRESSPTLPAEMCTSPDTGKWHGGSSETAHRPTHHVISNLIPKKVKKIQDTGTPMSMCVHARLRPHGLQPTRLLCPWGFPGKHAGVGDHFLLQGTFPTQVWNPRLLCLLHWPAASATWEALECSDRRQTFVQSCPTVSTPQTAACQAPLSIEFSRQEYWSGLPFLSSGESSRPRD